MQPELITIGVYGAVALIVKADDIGLALARNARTGLGRGLGRGILRAMPVVMQTLSIVGTAAMIWVGGGIIVHGLAGFGFDQIEHAIEASPLALIRLIAPTTEPQRMREIAARAQGFIYYIARMGVTGARGSNGTNGTAR